MSSLKGKKLRKDNFKHASDHPVGSDKKLENKDNLMFDSIIACVAVVDAHTKEIIDCNLPASKLIGLPKDKIIGKNINQFMSNSEDFKNYADNSYQSMKNYECVLLDSEGKKIPILKSVATVTWENHSYFIESFIDLTELKNKEKESWEINERYRAMVNDSVLGITIVDPDYKIIMTNSTFCKLFKKSAEEFKGKYCYKEYEKRDEICPHCPGKKAMATGRAADAETQAVLDDGTRIHVRNRAVPFFSQDGQLKGFIEMIENIDKRKKTEEALIKGEERFKHVAENLGDWIWEVNTEGLYTYSSPVVKEVLGYEPEEIIGKKHFYDLFVPDEKENFKKAAFEAFAKKESFRGFINPNVHKNGSIVILETSGTPIFDETGNLCGYQGADRDITERKEAEQRQAQLLKKLEKANEELRSFGYLVSHDLKAPLRGVKVLVDWICSDYKDKLDEEGRYNMELLVNRVDRMHNLIDGILQYSRVGRSKEYISQVNLNELLIDIIDMIAPPENIEITIEDELPVIECERTRITQVFQNLLSNAVKYMDKSQGLIKIGCIEERDCWKFSVKDNGPGIEEKYYDKIFQMFQTLSARDKFESTGVGLTVVQKIVELYGGKIWIESQVGQGSTFIFTIPKHQEQKERIENEKLQTSSIS